MDTMVIMLITTILVASNGISQTATETTLATCQWAQQQLKAERVRGPGPGFLSDTFITRRVDCIPVK